MRTWRKIDCKLNEELLSLPSPSIENQDQKGGLHGELIGIVESQEKPRTPWMNADGVEGVAVAGGLREEG